ncbi:MAG TPA: hypothetical protein VFU76_14795 [Terriglobales bacterium]|nr:hypothetical protein [Terriglobales bacterium]
MATVLCASYEWNLGFDELRSLHEAGHVLITVHDGLEALRTLAGGNVDAVLVSRTLPDVEVSALVDYIREARPKLPIILITEAIPNPKTAPKAIDCVLPKSYTAALLVPALDLLLQARGDKRDAQISPEMAA